MFSPLRNRFGIPGAISVIALVFAMLGGAYAANNSGGAKATASAKGKPGPRGKTGKTGPAGPAGPAGPQGPAGAKGDAGAAGANGKDGTNGTNGTNGSPGAPGAAGKSVIFVGTFEGADEEPPNEGPCLGAGGSEYETEDSGTPNVVCNGEKGATGAPWPAGGTLPAGATETGTWAFTAGDDAGENILAPISFPIPLSTDELGEGHVHYQGQEGFDAACPGGLFGVANPKADPGELCVYRTQNSLTLVNATFAAINPPTFLLEPGAGKTGAVVRFTFSGEPGETAYGFGSWAITGQ